MLDRLRPAPRILPDRALGTATRVDTQAPVRAGGVLELLLAAQAQDYRGNWPYLLAGLPVRDRLQEGVPLALV